MDIGLEDLLTFKERRQDDLFELRKKLSDFEHDISQYDSIEALKASTARFREPWQTKIIHAERMFRGDRVGFVLGSLRLFVVDAGGAAGLAQWIQSLGSTTVPSVAFGSLVGMTGLIGVGLQFRDYRKKSKRSSSKRWFCIYCGCISMRVNS